MVLSLVCSTVEKPVSWWNILGNTNLWFPSLGNRLSKQKDILFDVTKNDREHNVT